MDANVNKVLSKKYFKAVKISDRGVQSLLI